MVEQCVVLQPVGTLKHQGCWHRSPSTYAMGTSRCFVLCVSNNVVGSFPLVLLKRVKLSFQKVHEMNLLTAAFYFVFLSIHSRSLSYVAY